MSDKIFRTLTSGNYKINNKTPKFKGISLLYKGDITIKLPCNCYKKQQKPLIVFITIKDILFFIPMLDFLENIE